MRSIKANPSIYVSIYIRTCIFVFDVHMHVGQISSFSWKFW